MQATFTDSLYATGEQSVPPARRDRGTAAPCTVGGAPPISHGFTRMCAAFLWLLAQLIFGVFGYTVCSVIAGLLAMGFMLTADYAYQCEDRENATV